MKKLGFIAVLFLAVVGLFACAGQKGTSTNKSSKLNVVATNSIIADITKNIAGDKINLHSIVPVGKDPHEYEPLPEDVKKTSKADLIFYNGINLKLAEMLGLQNWSKMRKRLRTKITML